MSGQLPPALFFGKTPEDSGSSQYFYKLVGSGSADGFQLVLELADGEGAFVSKFTLEDLHRAQDAEDRLVPNDRSELLQWLGAAFGEGKPVGVHGVGAKRVLTGTYTYPFSDTPTAVPISLPPKGAAQAQLSKGSDGFNWVVQDMMASMVETIHTFQRRLADCIEHHATAAQQVASISNFVTGVLAGQDAGGRGGASSFGASPSKRARQAGGSPHEDAGSAMKQRPPAAAGAAEARPRSPGLSSLPVSSVQPAAAPSVNVPSAQAPAASEQPTVSNARDAGAAAGAAAPAQSQQTGDASQLTGQRDFTKPALARSGARGKGPPPRPDLLKKRGGKR